MSSCSELVLARRRRPTGKCVAMTVGHVGAIDLSFGWRGGQAALTVEPDEIGIKIPTAACARSARRMSDAAVAHAAGPTSFVSRPRLRAFVAAAYRQCIFDAVGRDSEISFPAYFPVR